jgi:hypothetical protein
MYFNLLFMGKCDFNPCTTGLQAELPSSMVNGLAVSERDARKT